MVGLGLACGKSDVKQTRKDEMEDMMLKEAEDFLQRLQRHPYNRKSKVFTIEELGIEKLVSYLCRWNMLADVLIVVWDGVLELCEVLTDILAEKKKKRIRMEDDVTRLLKESHKRCIEILLAKEAREEKKESHDGFEGERRVEEISNCHSHGIFGEAINYEQVREQLFNINAQKRRLLNVLEEHHHIVETIREEFLSPTIRSDLDKGVKSFVDHYQYLNSKLDELSAHYNGMIKQWFS